MKAAIRRKPRATAVATRQKILDAALTVFSRHGYEGSTTRKIAATAKLEHGHLAKYFRSKDALWLDVIKGCTTEIERILDTHLTDTATRRPQVRARAVLPALLQFFAHNHRLTRLMLQEFSVSSPRHDWVVINVGQPIWNRLKQLFEDLHPPQRRSPHAAAFAYFALIGSASLFFGSSLEVKMIAGMDPSDPAVVDAYIAHLVKTLLGPE
jgi:TetR/AcrR family transcriptional regulator